MAEQFLRTMLTPAVRDAQRRHYGRSYPEYGSATLPDELGPSEIAFLQERGILYRLSGRLTPMQQHLDCGRFEVKTGVADNEHAYMSVKFTAKGVNWIAGEWGKFRVMGIAA